MAIVWELDLPPGEKLVLLALADQANDHGTQCWPSVETIAHRSGQGVRTVRRALASLEAAGHLTRQHRDGTSTQYRVHPGQNGSPAKSAPLPKTTKTPAKLAPKPPRTIKQTKQLHAMPANWEPSEFGPNTKSGKIVASWSDDERAEQFERFAAHHRKLGNQWDCWQAAWSTWVLNTQRFKTRDPPPQRGSSIASLLDDVRQVHGL